MSAMAGQTVGPKWLTFFWEPMGTPGRAKKNGIYFFQNWTFSFFKFYFLIPRATPGTSASL